MPRVPSGSLVVALILALVGVVRAHGGAYRGPVPVPALPPIGGPPTGGVPGMPTGPNTGGSDRAAPLTSWSWWWEFNKDRYLNLKEIVRQVGEAAPAAADGRTGTAPGAARGGLGPTPDDIRDRVLPALKKLIDSSDNRDIATACMMAMAKVGARHPEVDILAECRRRLASGNQEVRETAALALGVSGLAEAFDDLVALTTDARRGRELCDRSEVDERTRAFATYGLGLLARRDPGAEMRQRALETLAGFLADDPRGEPVESSREVRVAALHAIGLLDPDPANSLDKRTRWQALDVIATRLADDLRRGDEIVRAHAPTAAARLLGRGSTTDHQRILSLLIDNVDPRADGARDRHFTLEQSSVLALGEIGLPVGTSELHDRVSDALQEYTKEGRNQDAQHFALVALARIGGIENRDFLLRAHRGGKKGREKPWAALALGIYVRDAMDRGAPPDQLVLEYLHKAFVREANDEHRAASAIALGLCGYQKAERDIIRELEKNHRHDVLAGDLAVALGLLGTDDGLRAVRGLIEEAKRRPYLLAEAAIAMALFGRKDTVPELLALMDDSDNLARLAGIASAFRYVGDRRAIDPLIGRMFENDTTTLTRAFMAAALGGVADKDLLPWNEPIAAGSNYLANVPTLRDGATGILDIL